MILKNGKRLDGCSDTVPIGTLNPYMGSVAPYGYLICEGQLVSKTTYKELYEICGDTFGTGTTTEFRLPDLRGKTIAGYKEGDTLFGVLGKLIGSENHTHNIEHTHGVPGVAHTHSTGNHTLTVAEIPSHNHSKIQVSSYVLSAWGTSSSSGSQDTMNWTASAVKTTGNNNAATSYTGSGGAHSHGNTGSTTPNSTTTNSQSTTTSGNASSIQPTVVMNWIVKAFLLMPNQSYVENSLTSTSEINSLSAAKGKELKTLVDSKYPFTGATTDNLDIITSPMYRSSVNAAGLPSGLGANSCMVLNSTANSQYVGQLAFSFGNNSIALRRRYGTTTWTDWTYLNFDTVNNDIKDTGWINATLLDGWVNYGTYANAGYRKIGKIVYLRGLIKKPSYTPGTTSTFIQLPEGYRPAGQGIFMGWSSANQAIRIDIQSTGSVQLSQFTSPAISPGEYVSLEGISFVAG